MKKIKQILNYTFALFIIVSCTEDDFSSAFIDEIAAPTNVSAAVTVTQDNTGLVTITPLGEGVTNFTINFGDGSDVSDSIAPGANAQHVYAEGTYDLSVTAYGLNDLTTTVSQPLVVSFQAPQNLVVIIENDPAISKQVNVNATADFAMFFEVDFGDGTELVQANIGETASHIYQDAGLYTIIVTAMGAAIETTSYTEVDFEVTEIIQPLVPATTPPSRAEGDVISIFSDAYTSIPDVDFFPNWNQSTTFNLFDLAGDEMLQYTNLNYQGIDFAATPVDASQMEFLHVDIWTADENDAKISPISPGPNETAYDLDLTAQQWTSFDIPLSFFTDQNPLVDLSSIIQFKFDGVPAGGAIFVDNLYFWKAAAGPSPLVGTWRIAPEDAALSVGPGDGSGDLWWYLNQFGDDVTTRACYMDDGYVFNEDGTFQNDLGADTWLENWQGDGSQHEVCGSPIAPHDGTNPATYTDNGSTITLNGLGAYLGLPKVHNTGENGAPVNNTITYNYVLSNNNNTLEITISGFNGGTEVWYYKLIKDAPEDSSLVGTWRIAPEDAALSVGPGDGSGDLWWYLNQFGDDVTTRACFMDDDYVFNADGTFQNVLGADTWLENWQGDGSQHEVCGTPIAPHDGSNPATYTNDGSTVTLNGLGAYLGLPKVHNTGEDGAPVGNTIIYDYVLSDNNNTLEITISGFNGGTEIWYYKLLKQ